LQTLRVFLTLSVLVSAAFAADLKIKVVDPSSSVVANAEVTLFYSGQSSPIGVHATSADGTALFTGVSGTCRARVLAPGFAPETVTIEPSATTAVVQLHVAVTTETVVVSATRSPTPEGKSGSNVAVLDAPELELMQPTSAAESLRFLPGAVVDAQGQRGSLASLFVRGGDSRYNKVLLDGVPVNDPGGTFDFGVAPLQEAERVEFVRGAQSTLYGSDAMTSVVQVWTATGSTPVPELRFGADGGNFSTANGYMSLAGANGPFDYNAYGDQFNTAGQGLNNDYSNSSQGANLGLRLSPRALLRFRTRHSNSSTGVSGEWDFNGIPLMPPDSDQWARQNNLLASTELYIGGPSQWQHRFTGFEYHHRRTNVDTIDDPGRIFDTPFHTIADINRAGFDYQGDYLARSWARTTVGYEFEDENGFAGDLNFPPVTHGLRLNHAAYGQEILTLGRLSVVAGARFVHNATFGNKAVPRVALGFQAVKGGDVFSGTRLHFSYATGIKEPRIEESFASGPFIVPNPNLRAEENRAFEAGFEEVLVDGKYSLNGTYFNNLFRNQIDFAILDPNTFTGQYENIDKSMAHGAELVLQGRPTSRVAVQFGYAYTSTQILEQPFAFDPLHAPGQPLLRRPKHSGNALLSYLGHRWGGTLGGTFVGRRPDSDFLGLGVDHAAGYARFDLGGWYAVTSRISAYVNVENVFNKHYNEVVGYPALGANFRAGMRFRLGGE
jgi:outer membrane cobalamin receptor